MHVKTVITQEKQKVWRKNNDIGFRSIQTPESVRVRCVQPCEALMRGEAVIWHSPCFPKASASNWPGYPISEGTSWSVSQWALLEAGFGSTGCRAQMGRWWGLLSSSPSRTWETGVFMCHLLAETKGSERKMRKWNSMWRYEIGSKNVLNRNQ